jgi:hypothetical protein
MQWLMPISPTIKEVEIRRWFEDSLSKKLARPQLNK